ncbi:MAG: hypothetical protein ACTHNN_19565 [Xanthobacteraceae bacterium]
MTHEARETYPDLPCDHIGMKALWCTVLEHTINEATKPIPASASTQQRIDILSARRMIMDQSRDFAIICGFAGYEADRVHAMVAPRIEAVQQQDRGRPVKPQHQHNGRGRNGKRYEFDGREQTLSEWANEAGLSVDTVRWRIQSGMSLGDALTTPINEQRTRKRSDDTGGSDKLFENAA